MDSFFGQQYDGSDLKNSDMVSHDDDPMSGVTPDFGDASMYSNDAFGDSTLGQEPPRHNSMQSQMSNAAYSNSQHQQNQQANQRRQSMPEFNNASARVNGNLGTFRFNSNASGVFIPAEMMQQHSGSNDGANQQSINLVTQYLGGGQQMPNMVSPVQATFPGGQQMNLTLQHTGVMAQGIPVHMDLSQANIANAPKNMPHFGTMQDQFMPSVMLQLPQQNMASQSTQQLTSPHDASGDGSAHMQASPVAHSPHDRMNNMTLNMSTHLQPPGSLSRNTSMSTASPMQGSDGMAQMNFQTQAQHQPQAQNVNHNHSQDHRRPQGDVPLRQDQYTWQRQRGSQIQHVSPMTVRAAPSQDNYANAYSSTGFDMLNVLVRVATRPNPEIHIGAVDLSCAFVVCDAKAHDFPIIYCSENFERLTGYTKHEILGRNCRFLQAPDGKVRAGVKRSYVDDDAVLYLKNRITERSEAQVSLINYRKGGQPFMNLLTMIPVSFDDGDVRFFVGFQVDLVEQPSSVTNKSKDGTYTVNYQRGLHMPRYVYNGAENVPQLDSGQTVSRDDVSTVLTTIGSGESDLSRRIWDKVLLENTDDVVFVLSLKGLFLYLSPASKRVLEYEPQQLVGTALSSVCHPSDIVPVTRELKDTSTSSTVNVVFRMRRKESGYMWFEGFGSLHTEQGKGRKSIVLVGRERPVYSVSITDIQAAGGIGENEVWTKLSTSGMFLYVSSSIRAMLDKTPEELMGTSIQALMRADSRKEFQRVLEIARGGKRASTKHELLNKRGQVLQAVSTVYPGDAVEGSKPTFFVAQTRLVKYSRPTAGNSQRSTHQTVAKLERDSSGSTAGKNPSPAHSGMHTSRSHSSVMSTQASLPSPARFLGAYESATTYAGGDGLAVGHQDIALASELNLFDELKTTRSTSWQFELRQMEKRNRLLAEELQGLLAARKKRKRRKGGLVERDCANCHTKQTPEWRRGPSGNRDLCNSCGLRWAKQQGRISPRTSSQRSTHSDGKTSGSPLHNNAGKDSGEASSDRRASGGAVEPRGIDETLAETKQGFGGEPRGGSSTHVSKSARTGSGNTATATKVEDSGNDSTA